MTSVAKENPDQAQSATSDRQQYLSFMLGDETFAVGILHIREIIEYGQLTRVPRMPEFIRGVINLRGTVVPVIDLGARFGAGRSETNRRSCIVIVEVDNDGGKQDIGILVDAVNEVLEISANQVEPPPAFGARIRTDFIAGMGKVDDRFVIILNVNHVLSLEDLAVLASVADAASDRQE